MVKVKASATAQTVHVAGTQMPANDSNFNASGEELLLSYLLWDTKFEDGAEEQFEDSIDVFLTAQGEKSLTTI